MKIAVVGASAAGLFASLLLARAGHQVVALEQERLDGSLDVESAAAAAFRATAPQIVQPHAVMARCRELIRDRLPDVYGRLIAAGAVEAPLSAIMPATLADRSGRPGDDRLTPLLSRRSGTPSSALRSQALCQKTATW
jgi:2-polyprenyl-6-methoxyphenol hydroxylase-like FAD-dependent oxidoreductase